MRKYALWIVAVLALALGGVGVASAAPITTQPVDVPAPALYAAAQPLPVGFYSDGKFLVCVSSSSPYTVFGHSGSKTKACPAGTRLGTVNVKGDKGDKGSTGATGAKGAKGDTGPKGDPGTSTAADFPEVQFANPLANNTVVKSGGKAEERATPLTGKLTLEPGQYEYKMNGQFNHSKVSNIDDPNTYGALFLWADRDGDALYEWKGDEKLGFTGQSPQYKLSQSGEFQVSTTGYFTLVTKTDVLLGGMSYNNDQSSTGEGNNSFTNAQLSVMRVGPSPE